MGHSTIDCYNCMNHAYEGRIPPQRLSAMISASTSFGSPNWLTDTSANAHITLDNGNLMHPRDYNGQDTIGGSGLPIKSIGHSYLSANSSTFLLNNVHHCPQASHNILSIRKFANDNHCSFTFFLDYFVVQDLATKKTLFCGPSSNGLYLFPSRIFQPSHPFAYVGVRSDARIWHSQLGHPSSVVLNKLISFNKPLILGS